MGASVSAICAQAKVIGGTTSTDPSTAGAQSSYTPITISPIVDKAAAAAKRRRKEEEEAAKRRRKLESAKPTMIVYKTPVGQTKAGTKTVVIQQQQLQQQPQSQAANAKKRAKQSQQSQQQAQTLKELETVLVQLPSGEVVRVLKSSIPQEMLQHLDQAPEAMPLQTSSAGMLPQSAEMHAGEMSQQPLEQQQQVVEEQPLNQRAVSAVNMAQQKSIQDSGLTQQSFHAGETIQPNAQFSSDSTFVSQSEPQQQQLRMNVSVAPSAASEATAQPAESSQQTAAISTATMSAEGGMSLSLGPEAMSGLVNGNFIEIDGQLYQIQEGGEAV